MKQLHYDFYQLCKRNKDGSFATQAARKRILKLAADQLYELGYKDIRAYSLKGRHISSLIDRWNLEGLSTGTVKNRMSVLRWWAEKVNRSSVINRDNSNYGIPERSYKLTYSKAKTISNEALHNIEDKWTRASLLLQREFGLRREEAIKIKPVWADMKTTLRLKDTWTKGGRARTLPILQPSQIDALHQSKIQSGNGSLIPPDKTYIQQLKVYERHTSRNGFNKMHGLRHQYAQNRYIALTGWSCPIAGGPNKSEMSELQIKKDHDSRQIISRELGHERVDIVNAYIGSSTNSINQE